MKLQIDLWIMLFFAFSIQALILGFLFFIKRKGDRTANIIFGVFLLLFSYNLIFNCAYWTADQGWFHPHLVFTNHIPWLLYGPLLYCYIRRVLFKTNFSLKDSFHAIPLVLFLIEYGDFFILSASEKVAVLSNSTAVIEMFSNLTIMNNMIIVIISLQCFYVILIFSIYKKYQKETAAVSQQIQLWTLSLWFCFTAYVGIFMLYFISVYFQLISLTGDYIIGCFIVLFIGVVSYFSFIQPDIFSGKKHIPFVKYKKNGLPPAFALEMKHELQHLMQHQKIYLDHTLTLDKLAGLLNLSRHHTSQLINEHFQTNFFEFINNYRVKEATFLLADSSNGMNVNEIIDAVGFNNRSSFYKAFKKKTGMSPKSYQQQYTV